ncbi:MAG: hypothetical protein ACREI3_09510 [Nitrospirales bacterium]
MAWLARERDPVGHRARDPVFQWFLDHRLFSARVVYLASHARVLVLTVAVLSYEFVYKEQRAVPVAASPDRST